MEVSEETELFLQVASQKEEEKLFAPTIPQSYPWFVISDGKYKERQIFFSISENRFSTKSIPEMRNKMIYANTNGWLVLKDVDSLDLCVLNPISKEVVQLPRLETIDDCRICILSSPPGDPNDHCHIIFFNSKRSIFYFCQPGDSKFGQQEFEDIGILDATMYGGKLYILTLQELFTAEFVGSELRFMESGMELTKLPPPRIVRFWTYLIESCGELLYVHVIFFPAHMVYGFLIFQMDHTEKKWIQVKSIGERTIFLANNKGMSCIARERGVKQNSIYFTKSRDRFLYVFDLEDCGISKSLPCPIVSYYGINIDWVML